MLGRTKKVRPSQLEARQQNRKPNDLSGNHPQLDARLPQALVAAKAAARAATGNYQDASTRFTTKQPIISTAPRRIPDKKQSRSISIEDIYRPVPPIRRGRDAWSSSDSQRSIRIPLYRSRFRPASPTRSTSTDDLDKPRSEFGDISLPSWFVEHCVLLREELAAATHGLKLRHGDMQHRQSRHDTRLESSEQYEIDSILYEPLRAVLQQSESGKEQDNNSSSVFSCCAVLLKLPARFKSHGGQFLQEVVEQFARDAKADLVILNMDDMEDIHTLDPNGIRPMRPISSLLPSILNALDTKRIGEVEDRDQLSPEPLVVHLQEVNEMFERHCRSCINGLAEGIKRSCPPNTIVVSSMSTPGASRTSNTKHGTSDESDFDDEHSDKDASDPINRLLGGRAGVPRTSGRGEPERENKWQIFDEETILAATAGREKSQTIELAPIGNGVQKALFASFKKERQIAKNIRSVQRSARQMYPQSASLLVLQPYAVWDFLQASPTLPLFSTGLLTDYQIDKMVKPWDASSDESFKKHLLACGLRKEALEESRRGFKTSSKAGPRLPPRIQEVIQSIKAKPYKYEWEGDLLNCIVDTNEGPSWNDIVLEPGVRDNVQQLLNQPAHRGTTTYGVLQKGRIGGILLYGPPGCGKTHLARVIASEIDAAMLSVSAADMLHRSIGHSEKSIKALFNLGRMLSPCVIFIDEADALLRRRQPDDRSWERSQVNQFLSEMDGLTRHEGAPFLLLATNLPQDLDHAVLRRVLSRICIGLPSPEARRRILEVCLQGETVDSNVDLLRLAARTANYVGSDLLNLCVQTALISESSPQAQPSTSRVLHQSDFETALTRSEPTVTISVLAGIREFARQFDPRALDILVTEPKQEAYATAFPGQFGSTGIAYRTMGFRDDGHGIGKSYRGYVPQRNSVTEEHDRNYQSRFEAAAALLMGSTENGEDPPP